MPWCSMTKLFGLMTRMHGWAKGWLNGWLADTRLVVLWINKLFRNIKKID